MWSSSLGILLGPTFRSGAKIRGELAIAIRAITVVVHKQYNGNDGVKLFKGNATSNYEISSKRQIESQAEEDVKSSGLLQLPGATEKVISVTDKSVLFFLEF